MKETILIADDNKDVLSALTYLLQVEGYEVTAVSSVDGILSTLKRNSFSALLMDMNYSEDTTSGREGVDVIRKIVAEDRVLPVIAMTAWGSIELAVEALQAGARDFVTKPWENERVLNVVKTQIRLAKAERKSDLLAAENQLLRSDSQGLRGELDSQSPIMKQTIDKLRQLAASDVNILLTGENGTGKSHFVKLIHQMSPRKDGPLITVNMGSITETLFESEMFGHIKGAFTDARDTRFGRFELAQGGTLFLDEIANTPFTQQAKLLRVLEERRFEKVGSARTQETNCRLVAATNVNLDEAISKGLFRQDLLYRINTVEIEIPPLRQRKEDVLEMANCFLEIFRERYAKPNLCFSGTAATAMLQYSWPGNVRELRHVVERSVILSSKSIDSMHLGLSLSRKPEAKNDIELTLDQIEKNVIASRLGYFDGNSLQAAESLGLSKSAFYRHIKKHRL